MHFALEIEDEVCYRLNPLPSGYARHAKPNAPAMLGTAKEGLTSPS